MRHSPALLLLCLALVGCVTKQREEPIRVAPIHVTVDRTISLEATAPGSSFAATYVFDRTIGEESLVGEIWIGSVAHLLRAKRWPASLEELNDAFSGSDRCRSSCHASLGLISRPWKMVDLSSSSIRAAQEADDLFSMSRMKMSRTSRYRQPGCRQINSGSPPQSERTPPGV